MVRRSLEVTTIADQVWIAGVPVEMTSRQTELRDRYPSASSASKLAEQLRQGVRSGPRSLGQNPRGTRKDRLNGCIRWSLERARASPHGSIPRRDWAAVWSAIEPVADEAERARLWAAAGRDWLAELTGVLGPDYAVHDVSGFWVVSNRSAANLKGIGSHLRRARARILEELEGISAVDPWGSLAILWLEDEAQYYEYVSYFYP